MVSIYTSFLTFMLKSQTRLGDISKTNFVSQWKSMYVGMFMSKDTTRLVALIEGQTPFSLNGQKLFKTQK